MGNARKALEEEDVGAFVTEAAPFASEPTVVPETVDKLDTSTDAYDFKEYDLKEYDLGEVDGRLYDYGAYEEYGTATPELTATDDEVGPGVAAETDIVENTVSTTLTRRPRVGSGMFRGFMFDGVSQPSGACLPGSLSWVLMLLGWMEASACLP